MQHDAPFPSLRRWHRCRDQGLELAAAGSRFASRRIPSQHGA
jgi:hypothetical protein